MQLGLEEHQEQVQPLAWLFSIIIPYQKLDYHGHLKGW
jgi:hypothetical protein